MSFVIDPPLLVASGAAIEAAVGEDEANARRLRGGVVALFALYPLWIRLGSALVRTARSA